MTTNRTQRVMVRIPTEAAEYVEALGRMSERTVSEVIREIIAERMATDSRIGAYTKIGGIPSKNGRPRKASEDLGRPSGCSAFGGRPPSPCTGTDTPYAGDREDPEIGRSGALDGSSEAPRTSGSPDYFGQAHKPIWPGTREDYDNAIRRGIINRNAFAPPE